MSKNNGKDEEKLSRCGHVEALADNRLLYVDSILSIKDGTSSTAVLLREVKDGRNGRLVVGKRWIQVLHCPICGEKLLTQDRTQPSATEETLKGV